MFKKINGLKTIVDRRESKRRVRFVLLSIFLHVLFVSTLFLFEKSPNTNLKNGASPVEIVIIEVPKKDISSQKQIVETDLAEKTEKIDENAFLGQQTQIVRKQFRAHSTDTFRPGQVAKPSTGTTLSNGSEKKIQTNGLSLKSLAINTSVAPVGHIPPGSSSNDYVRNVEQGAQTLLNTREYVYFSYYQRVRQQLEQFWEPNLRARLKKFFQKGRSLASDKEHSTRLLVYLDNAGAITKIEVQDTSGLLELDQAAIDAFNKAGPFPNPPKGMLEANNGSIKVEWEFVLRT